MTGLEEDGLGSNPTVYPNPFKEQLIVETKGAFHFQLLDNAGRILEERNGNDKIELAGNHPKGIYLLKMQQGEKSQVFKVVKE